MDSIFFEKQEGSLCAQHALNALLQGSYFTAVELAAIARRLDDQERNVYASAGVDSVEYLRALHEESHNMDDSGYFSVQVISEALSVWNLSLIPYMSDASAAVRADPTIQKAYICNFREHWFTIRKLGFQWFNLNSMLNGPELISDTYLHMFLTQLQNEGYSIFIVDGELPNCRVDEILQSAPVDPALAAVSSSAANQRGSGSSGNRLTDRLADDDPELAAALELSRREADKNDEELLRALAISREMHDMGDPSLTQVLTNSANLLQDEQLQEAIRLSMTSGNNEDNGVSSSNQKQASKGEDSGEKNAEVGKQANVENLRKQREPFLNRLEKNESALPGASKNSSDEDGDKR